MLIACVREIGKYEAEVRGYVDARANQNEKRADAIIGKV